MADNNNNPNQRRAPHPQPSNQQKQQQQQQGGGGNGGGTNRNNNNNRQQQRHDDASPKPSSSTDNRPQQQQQNRPNPQHQQFRVPKPKSSSTAEAPMAMFATNTLDDWNQLSMTTGPTNAPQDGGMFPNETSSSMGDDQSSTVTMSTQPRQQQQAQARARFRDPGAAMADSSSAGGSTAHTTSTLSRPRLSNLHLSQSIAKQLAKGNYECAICTEAIRHAAPTWSCGNCFRVFHLGCIKKWAHQEESGSGTAFRCPSCQTTHPSCPQIYKCFCGKTTDPKPDGFLTPHTCGEPCGRKRGGGCPHPCTAPCHPGPCLDCSNKSEAVNCPCGKTSYQYGCGKPDPLRTCENICNKLLKCGNHRCTMRCHHGPCEQCIEAVSLPCKCAKTTKKLPCGTKEWDCQATCNKLQRCGTHKCKTQCHSGNCPPCDTDPEVIYTCPCGKKALDRTKRSKCTDPVPTCEGICDKVLLCGSHHCTEPCHAGPCPPCEAKTRVTCPCGSTTSTLLCNDAPGFHCQRQCKMKLDCGRHDCSTVCCSQRLNANANAQGHHMCNRTCNRRLGCGHHCTEACHRGPCPPCYHVIGEELRCGCGAHVLEPPLPCGTLPPKCDLPCNKILPCGHEPHPHKCHLGECPVCTVPVEKECVGGHTKISVMCHTPLTNVICGRVCGKKLHCGHGCPKRCHKDECEDINRKTCGQPCGQKLSCGHRCQAKCHQKGCPNCTTQVEVMCECGIQTVKMRCKEYLQLVERFKEKHAVEMAERDAKRQLKNSPIPTEVPPPKSESVDPPPPPTEEGNARSIDEESQSSKPSEPFRAAEDDDVEVEAQVRSHPTTNSQREGNALMTGDSGSEVDDNAPFVIFAPCNDDCMYERRLAALSSISSSNTGADRFGGGAAAANHAKKTGIKNVFSIRAWQFAKKGIDAVCSVERHLEEFVRSQERMRTLPPMHRDKRAIVHEVANYYHVTSEAVDKEPNRTCVLQRTPLTRLPQSKLSDAVYDNQCSPMRMVHNVFDNGFTTASNHTIVFEGQMLSDVGVNKVLRHCIGQFVIVGPDDYAECGVPLPKRKPASKNVVPTHAFLAVFIRPSDATAALSMLRRNGCGLVYHRFGEMPPVHNTLDDHSPTKPEQRTAELYTDGSCFGDVASSTQVGSAAAPKQKGTAWGTPASAEPETSGASGGSWAARLQQQPRETQRQKEQKNNGKIEVVNRFGSLGKK